MKAMIHDIHSLFLHIASRYFTLFCEYTANCMNFMQILVEWCRVSDKSGAVVLE